MALPGGRRGRHVATAMLLLGALVATPASGAADDVPPPPGAAKAKVPRCKPSKNRICGKGATAPGAAAAQLVAATNRRGLGMATARGAAGRKAAKKLRAALGARPRGTLRAQATDVAGGVNDRDRSRSAHGVARLAPNIKDSVRVRVVARRGRFKDVRTFRWDAAVERCPDPGPPGNSTGKARLLGRGVWNIEVDEPRRDGSIVRTIVRLEAKLDTQAASSNRAELDFVGDLAKGRTPITVTRQTLVIRNGNSRRAAPMAVVDLTADILAPDTSVRFKSEDFDAFVERMQAQERGEPDPGADGPILGPAWKNLGKEFAEMVAARAWALARMAEQHWRTPNRCFTLTFDGPTKLRPSQRVELTGTPKAGERPATVRQILGDFVGSGTWTSLRPIGGAKIESLVQKLPLPEGKPWIALTAPAQRWKKGAGPGFDMTLATKAGIATFRRVYDEGLPDRFTGTARVNAAIAGAQQTTWTIELTYTLAEDLEHPDGSRDARYTLTAANVTAFEDLIGSSCLNKATATGGTIRFGDLELSLAADGAVSYAFVHDVGMGDLPYVPQGMVPPCAPTFTTLGVAFLNARTRANGLRPAGSDLRLIQADTDDLSANSLPMHTGTASWELVPG